jgi:MFS family permease
MFVLTLLLQVGLGQSPLRAGLEAGPLALAFTVTSVLGPRMAARLGPRAITTGAVLDVLGTTGLVLTGLRYGSHLTGWDLAPATALIGLGQGMALPSLIGMALSHVPPERAGAAAGILTTMQQFGVASGVAIIGAVYYTRLGPGAPGHGSAVPAMEVAMVIDAAAVLAAAGLTLLLPRRTAARPSALTAEPAAEQTAPPDEEAVPAP